MRQEQWLTGSPGRVTARIWALLEYLLSQRQKLLHLYKHEEGEKRKVAKILDWVLEILRARANAATNLPVTLGKFLFFASISPGPQLP